MNVVLNLGVKVTDYLKSNRTEQMAQTLIYIPYLLNGGWCRPGAQWNLTFREDWSQPRLKWLLEIHLTTKNILTEPSVLCTEEAEVI